MAEVKISIIGAGSATFSMSLVKDLCLTPNLKGSTISLMDVNESRLNAVYLLSRRYAEEMDMDLKIEKTQDRRESLRGSDFVVNTALVVGHAGYREGWLLGLKNGYRFGGSYHIMHDEGFWINFYQFKLFESIINDIFELCPDAWYIQLANPVLAGVTHLGRKYSKLKFVGLCHGFTGVYRIAEALGLDRNKISFEAPGVNHFIWLTQLHYEGEDVLPVLQQWVESKAKAYWEKCSPSSELGPKAVDLYRRFGAFPVGDTCTPGGGSWPWWYHVDDETERFWREDPKRWWSFIFEPHPEDPVLKFANVASDSSTKVTSVFLPIRSGEIIVPLIESIACDLPRVFIVNVMNSNDLVPGVPSDFEVEVPALVSKRGVQGLRTRGLSRPLISYLLRDRVTPVEVELEAYDSGSRELLLELVMMDPWTRSEKQAKALLDDILSLPRHEEMRQHYR
ncbi:MAG: alpha-glucosidase/alpha-galactosidase [Candidatus Bathyarchaeia archaeon]